MIFFSKKNYLKDLLNGEFIDIHSHLLPGIDDGSKSIENTLELLQGLKNQGFKQFTGTSHIFTGVWNNTKEIIENTAQKTNEVIKNHGFFIKPAAEYMMDTHFMELLKNETPLLTLKDNYVLVEMSYINPPIQLFEILFEIQIKGYQPVLAHPERYNFYHGNLDAFKKLKNSGCKFQLNMLSTVGYYGPAVSKCANDLLKNNLMDFIGSDVHHEKHLAAFEQKIMIKEIDSIKKLIENNQFFEN
jgi:protein-tyrosine phosphatase